MGEHNRPPHPPGPRPLPPLQLQQLRGAVQRDRAPGLPARLRGGHLGHCGEPEYNLAEILDVQCFWTEPQLNETLPANA